MQVRVVFFLTIAMMQVMIVDHMKVELEELSVNDGFIILAFLIQSRKLSTQLPLDILDSLRVLCSKREMCKSDLIAKLRVRDLQDETIDALFARLEEERFLDEKRYASSFVREKFRLNRWGRTKIKYALTLKRVPGEYIRQAMEEIEEVEYLKVLGDLLRSRMKQLKGPASRQKLASVYRYGLSRGFEGALVWKLLGQDEEPEEESFNEE